MLKRKEYKFWFCTGSQDLYGDECLAHVAEHSRIIVEKLNESGNLPYEVVLKPTLITNELIRKTFRTAGGFRGTRLRSGVFCFFAPFGDRNNYRFVLQSII